MIHIMMLMFKCYVMNKFPIEICNNYNHLSSSRFKYRCTLQSARQDAADMSAIFVLRQACILNISSDVKYVGKF